MSDPLFNEKFFDESGNWRNSEVVADYLENLYESMHTNAGSDYQVDPELNDKEDAVNNIDDVYSALSSKAADILKGAISKLNKITNESSVYKNEKASLKIEEATSKVYSILDELENK